MPAPPAAFPPPFPAAGVASLLPQAPRECAPGDDSAQSVCGFDTDPGPAVEGSPAAIVNAASAAERAGGAAGGQDWRPVIDRRARHMARLLDDLLDVARLTHNKIDIRKSVFDLATTMGDAIEEVRAYLQERNIELTVSRSSVPLLVDGDPARLQQIQVNLLRNAAKYTPAGGQVWYSLQREEGQAVVQGPGSLGRPQGRQDGQRTGQPVRGPPDPHPRLEEATARWGRSGL